MANPNNRTGASGADRPSRQAASSPSLLAERVRAALATDPRFVGMNPVVEERSGTVHLQGWVPQLRDKKMIGRTVERIVGAVKVRNNLLVGPPNQRLDDEIRHEVDDFMMADISLDPTTIHADVTDGVVQLTGSIATTMYWRYVSALCWWIPGVRGVHNNLQIAHSEPPDDELLAAAVTLLFEKDPLVDVTEIEVICKAGVVSLSGTVGGQDAKDAAESDAWSIEGVREVVNQIEVVEIPGAPPIVGFSG